MSHDAPMAGRFHDPLCKAEPSLQPPSAICSRALDIHLGQSGSRDVEKAEAESQVATPDDTDVTPFSRARKKEAEKWKCMEDGGWGSLPRDILQAVAKRLPSTVASAIRLVNRHWSIAGRAQIQKVVIKSKDFTERSEFGDYLSQLANGTYCQLREMKLSAQFHEGYENLHKLTGLTSLDISGCSATSKQLSGIKSLTQLSTLAMGWTHLTDEGSIQLSGLKSLKSLNLEWCRISEVTLQHIAGLTKLERLSVCGMTWSSTTCLLPLAMQKELTFLDLSSIYLSDHTISPISALVKLVDLNLAMNPLSCAAMNVIAELTQLRKLDLKKTNVGNEGLGRLTSLVRLRELNLSGTAVEDRGFQVLTHLALLSSLDVSHNYMVGWDNLEHLMPLTSLIFLQQLNLQRTQASPSTVKYLASRFRRKRLWIEC